jgi:hypothetical protein
MTLGQKTFDFRILGCYDFMILGGNDWRTNDFGTKDSR